MNAVDPSPVRVRKLLKYINLSIAVLLVLLAVAVYWTAYRPLPQISGAVEAAVHAQGNVERDRLGVPHIHAASIEDAMFLQGYVTAQDRLWQMDALRRLAAGELSEVVGPGALTLDEESRRLRLRRIAEEQLRTLPPADLAVLAAYGRGVNEFIEHHRSRLPLEFTLLRYQPRPWRITDSLLAGLQMYRTLTSQWKDEIAKQAMLQGGNPAKVDFLFSSRTGREVQPGSNAWVVSGAHTASGKPILANDPHLEYSIPATWYMVHLQAPGLNVTGVSLPGIPCVIIGHNERIAWGVTNLGFDVQDFYQEQLDPGTGRYLFEGKTEQARFEQEVIAVKGGKPQTIGVWVTRHGPVLLPEKNRFLSLRWAAAEPGTFQFPFLDLDRASDWRSFGAALKRFSGPGQNFVYADVDGNIGYQATGLLPIRTGYDGGVPVDGSSGKFEWQGFIPFEKLPQAFNPTSGEIVTANQNPFPRDYEFPVHGNFAPEYRSQQIRNLLHAKSKLRAAEMITIQKDVYSGSLDFVAKRVVQAYDRKHPGDAPLKEAVELLRKWNGQMEKGQAAPLLMQLTYFELRKRAAMSASPVNGAVYEMQIAPALLQTIIASNGRGWFADEDDVLLQCLRAGLQAGSARQGSRLEKWDYGKYNELLIKQPVGSQLPVVAKYFNIGPFPMSGSSTTVKQTTQRLGPSMRFVADLASWDQSLNNITAGESGHVLSRHYSDQWDAYYYARGVPMQYQHVDAKSYLMFKPRPIPK